MHATVRSPKSIKFTETSGHKPNIYCIILLTQSPQPRKKIIIMHSVTWQDSGYSWEAVHAGNISGLPGGEGGDMISSFRCEFPEVSRLWKFIGLT